MKHPQMEMSVFVRRHKPDGSMKVVPCVMSLLSPDDGDDAVRLHDEVAHGLSKDIFVPSPPDEIRRYLGDEGLAVGIKHEGRLICLRTAITGKEWARYTAEGMALAPAYFNPAGGAHYHEDPNCATVDAAYLPLSVLPGLLRGSEPFNRLTPCETCCK